MKPLPIIIFIALSFFGYAKFIKYGLPDQQTHETLVEVAELNLVNSGAVWYGVLSYFNDNHVTDLMYKTRPCKHIKPRGTFYAGHNKYDFLQDTNLTYIIGDLWKPNRLELIELSKYKKTKFKNINIYRKEKK